MVEIDSYYGILGVSPHCSAEEIKRAFRDLARRYHPDMHPDQSTVDQFQKISEAYNVLSDPDARMNYDLKMGFADQPSNGQKSRAAESDSSEQPRRERKLSKVNIQALNKMVREGADDGPSNRGSRSRKDEESSTVNRLSIKLSPADKLRGFFRRMLRKVEKTASAAAAPSPESKSAEQGQQKKSGRGLRTFNFTIDALESVTGTIREVAFDELDEPRVVKIRIPAGVHDDAVIDAVSVNDDPTEMEIVRARIRIRPHKFVERDGYDLTLKVPVTVGEAVSGAELEVPTPNGPAKFILPPRWNVEQKFRLKGLGIVHPDKKFRGDLYVQPVVAVPDHTTQALDESAKMLDSFYFTNVRTHFPKNLFDPKR